MTKILVPIDFSDSTPRVLDAALNLARSLDAHLILLHVVEPVTQFVGGEAAFDIIQAPVTPSLDRPTQDLARQASHLQEKGIQTSSVITTGLPVDDILEESDKHSVDYIVLGSHGHGALYHLFSGSVVNGVLHGAHCPVIVVPATDKKEA
ncbi:MAG: universal stress protein [Chthoniobacterales bacterium]